MNVDKFGRHHWSVKARKKGLILSDNDEHFNIGQKKLTNLADPENDGDAVTKKYVDDITTWFTEILSKHITHAQTNINNANETITEIYLILKKFEDEIHAIYNHLKLPRRDTDFPEINQPQQQQQDNV